MKKSILSIILAVLLVITNCPVEAAGVKTAGTTACKTSGNNPIVTGYDANCDLFGETLNTMMETWLNNTSYNKVTINNSSDKAGFSSQIIFDIADKNLKYPASKSVFTQWVTQATFNYPNLCIASTTYSVNKNNQNIIQKCVFNSPVSASEIKNTITDYKEKLASLANSIPSSLTTSSAKLLYLHDQIAGMGDYNGDVASNAPEKASKRVYTPLGILIDGDGVCQSYSAVMNHAALAVGIPSIVVIGNSHAWNAMQVNNNWYYTDVTWDDASSTNNTLIGKISHEYFLVNHSKLSGSDDSTRPHAIDADFYKIFGGITDSILSSYPNAVPKSESNSYGIGKKMSFLNGSWYYCDNSSIYTWDGKAEYGTKTNAASGIINCCSFENTLYYAKSDGIFQYVNGINDKKLDDITASNITDMIITGNTLKYVENGQRKTYSLAKFSTATPTPTATATPSTSPTKTPAPTATATPSTSPTKTPAPTATTTSSTSPTKTQAPDATATTSASPTTTQTPTPTPTATSSTSPTGTPSPNATASPSAAPTTTQTPATTTVPTMEPSGTQAPDENSVTPTIMPSETQTPTDSDETIAPANTPIPTAVATRKPQISDYDDNPFPDEDEDNPYSDDEDEDDDDSQETNSKKLKKGSKVNDQKTKTVYTITGTGKNKTVEYTGSLKKNATNINIPATVKLNGKTYKVTSIGNGAFQGNKKLTLVKVGKNIKKIGNKAFYKCKNLRYLLFKTKKLTSSSIGKNAFGGSYASPRVKTDKSKWKQYSKILFSKGMSKKAVFIINPVKLVV